MGLCKSLSPAIANKLDVYFTVSKVAAQTYVPIDITLAPSPLLLSLLDPSLNHYLFLLKNPKSPMP